MMNTPCVQINLPCMPVVAIFVLDGTIAFVKTAIEDCYSIEGEDGVNAVIIDSGIELTCNKTQEKLELDYSVRYNYKQKPILLRWLQGLKLSNPFDV